MNSKKGQGLSLQTIIIAIIVLIVLVVIILIFTGKIGVFSSGVTSCADKGGVCILESTTGNTNLAKCRNDDTLKIQGEYYYNSAAECESGKICCMQLYAKPKKTN